MRMHGWNFGAALAMVMLSACGDDDGMVGRSVCLGPEPACAPAVRWEQLGTVRSAVATAQPLVPVWNQTIEPHGAAMSESTSQVTVALGGGGTLWAFRSGPSQLSVSTFDASGNPTGQQVIAPPAGTTTDASGVMQELSSVTNHPMGPVLELGWQCAADYPDRCGKRELLVFGTDVSKEPTRISTPELHGIKAPAYRTHDGNALVIVSGSSLRKIDMRGELLWTHELSAKKLFRGAGLDEPGTGVFTDTSSFGALGAALLADDTLVTGAVYPTNGGFWPVGLLRVTPSGGSSLIRYQGHNDFAGAAGGVVVDRDNRPTVVRNASSGDLIALRVDGTVGVGHTIEHDDFLPLRLGTMAMDDANTLYVTTAAGGRLPEAQRQLLCRLPAQGDGRCFAIEGTQALDMEATTPGVVFVLSERGLARYDVPQD